MAERLESTNAGPSAIVDRFHLVLLERDSAFPRAVCRNRSHMPAGCAAKSSRPRTNNAGPGTRTDCENLPVRQGWQAGTLRPPSPVRTCQGDSGSQALPSPRSKLPPFRQPIASKMNQPPVARRLTGQSLALARLAPSTIDSSLRQTISG